MQRLSRAPRLLPLALLALSAAVQGQEAEPKRLTLEQTSGRGDDAPSFGARVALAKWADDGWLELASEGDEGAKKLRRIDPETREEVVVDAPAAGDDEEDSADQDEAAVAAALLSLPGFDAERAGKVAGRRRASAEGSGGARTVLMTDGATLVFYGRDAAGAERVGVVPEEEGPFELLELSGDGRFAFWVHDHDLSALNTLTGDLVPITENGGPERLNGKLDWVYQEELYGRGDFKGFWPSKDGEQVAFLSLDEAAVKEFTVVDHIEKGTFQIKAEVENYPLVGEPNPTVSLGLAATKDGATVWADLSRYEGSEPLVVRVGWAPDGRCLAMIQDRIQTWCELVTVDPASGALTPILRETSKTWVERPAWPEFLADGTFLWQSERTGRNHVYLCDAAGRFLHPVTRGDWTVRDVLEVDQERGLLFFTCSEGGAVDRNVYRVGLDGQGFRRLTDGRGTHQVTFRPDKRFFVDRVSSLASPEELRLCDADGSVLQVLERAEVPAAEAGYALAVWQLHEVPARDGTLLDVAVQLPVPFDEAQSYPVWIPTYSGPDAPSVRNRWSGNGWNQFLAEQGVIVMQVNVRSASNKGMWAVGQCYRRLGVQELSDLEDAVDWLTGNSWADGSRVGITGYSYGGFMSAYALLCSKKFALGVAGGGVYDWRMYDTIYTERYMATPALNEEGYEATSCLNKAERLSGFLHLHHGVMDDNVHFQNLMQMAYALQKAGKVNWSMTAYPQTRHGLSDRDLAWHARQVEWSLIQEHLRPGHVQGPAAAVSIPAGGTRR